MSNQLQPNNWVSLYADYLFSLAVIKIGNKELAEDIVQETFLSAFKARDSFKGNSSEKTWITSILKNKIIDHYRKKDVLKNVDEYLSDTEKNFHNSFFSNNEENYGHWTAATAPHDWGELPADQAILQQEFNKVVRYCIEKLPPRMVPVFMARFIDEEQAEKICKDFNITPSNYWVIIHRAKLLMRSCLEKNWISK